MLLFFEPLHLSYLLGSAPCRRPFQVRPKCAPLGFIASSYSAGRTPFVRWYIAKVFRQLPAQLVFHTPPFPSCPREVRLCESVHQHSCRPVEVELNQADYGVSSDPHGCSWYSSFRLL